MARGNVEAGFDDGGRKQDVIFAVVEGADLVLQLAHRQLPVRDDEFALRRVLSEERGAFLEILDARDHIEGLAAAISLAQQRLAHDDGVEGRDEAAHREPVDGGRGDDREIAHAGHGELQRARYRRGGERQHVDFGAQILQPLLVADAEMLLLVDDDEAEILERHRLAEQSVGAHDNVDRAVRQPLLHLALLGRRDHARELADLHRQSGEALGEILVVLAGEQGGRHDHRRLLAVDRGGEGGAQRHLRLAEADVAAHKPVHRPAGAEIVERRLDGARLVLGLVVGEAGAEFVVEPFRGREPRGGARQPLRGDAHELGRHVANALLQPRLAGLPACRAEPVELAGLRAVAGEQFEVFDRQEQPVAAGVVNLQAIVRRARRLDGLQADEAADAVVDVDDEIAGGQRRGFRQHVLRTPLALDLPHKPVAENVLFADDGEVGGLEAVLQRDDGERQRAAPLALRTCAKEETSSSDLSPCSASTWLSRSREPSDQPATTTVLPA